MSAMKGGGLARPRPRLAGKQILLGSPTLPYSPCVSKPLTVFSLSPPPLAVHVQHSDPGFLPCLSICGPSICNHNHGR